MGRELKRVPLDFNWPLNKTWGGFINPFYSQCVDCPQCKGSGSSREARHLSDQWYGKVPFKPQDRGSKPWRPTDAPIRAVAERHAKFNPGFYGKDEGSIYREANRLCELFNGTWSHHLNANDVAALVKADRLRDFKGTPTPEQVNAWSLDGFGHDAINSWVVIKAECKRLGYRLDCERCKGEASLWPSPKIKQQAKRWKPTEPPTGEGYQLWETVSEGSPVSPVFVSPEELADWLTINSGPCYSGTTREQWLKFIVGPGWAPSMISRGGRVMNGVQALGSQ